MRAHTAYPILPPIPPSLHPCVRDTRLLLGHCCRSRARYPLPAPSIPSPARFPPPCALVARHLRPRLGPRYLHHARPIVTACVLNLSARAPVARRSRAPSPPHAHSLLAAPAPPGHVATYTMHA
ncbi:hypothetical protein B0H14DRAFT_3524877 [Mycena olivaceomarginata]|nr:hypothetical protein B0H14DRAFT_3524877 [Mycena olivaceomarginata]